MSSVKNKFSLDSAVVRLCGDSGDGIQLIGSQFSNVTAIFGNDINTLPDFPAEIRAPAGTISGVSGFQIHFSSQHVSTPGDSLDTLVAMNPAAFKKNLGDLKKGGFLIVNKDAFTEVNCKRAGYESSPLNSLDLEENYKLIEIPMTSLTLNALKSLEMKTSDKQRCKNFFALGLMLWIYDRSLEKTSLWLEKKFSKKVILQKASRMTLKAGYHYGDISEIFDTRFSVRKVDFKPGLYRQISGNIALANGLIIASKKAGLNLVYTGYPITPASDILHELSKHKAYGVKTVQAEDEISAIGMALGASYAGGMGVTASSGPGICLKSEFLGLGLVVELPLIVIDVQRGGPSTGLPTKVEQSDLMLSLYGRNGESPIPILAPQTPGDCFYIAYEAVKIAVTYMTPVFILSDGYLSNGSDLWRVPKIEDLADIKCHFYEKEEGKEWRTYQRDEKSLARSWVKPGTKDLQHILTGLEKDLYGNISYDAENHQMMSELRRDKIMGIADSYPKTELYGANEGDFLFLSWGGTFGSVRTAVEELIKSGESLGHIHLRYLNPLPKDLEGIFSRFKKILVFELNLGQLLVILKSRYKGDFFGVNKIQGKPFMVNEIINRFGQFHV